MWSERSSKKSRNLGETKVLGPQKSFPTCRLDEVFERDRELFRQSEAQRESERRTASFEEEERMNEEDRQNARKEIVQLFQRMQPLRSMIERAIRHDEPVMWGKPH